MMLTDDRMAHDVRRQERPWQALTRLPLPHKPEAASRARRHTREALALRSVCEDVAATVELAVSELVTNAVRHGVCPCGCTRGAVSLALFGCGERVRVEVGDPSRTPPRWPTGVESVDSEATEGRGLLIVMGLATDWGDHARRLRGKVVWCEIAPTTWLLPPTDSSRREPPPTGVPAGASAATLVCAGLCGHCPGPRPATGDGARTVLPPAGPAAAPAPKRQSPSVS